MGFNGLYVQASSKSVGNAREWIEVCRDPNKDRGVELVMKVWDGMKLGEMKPMGMVSRSQGLLLPL